MSDFFLFIGGCSIIALPIFLIILVVLLIKHKSIKKIGITCLALLVSFVVFESIGVATGCHHNFILVDETQATCIDQGKKTLKCEFCEKQKIEKIQPFGHDLTVVSDKKPSDKSQGEIIKKCSRCDYEEKEIIETLQTTKCSHEWEDNLNKSTKVCKLCGESVPLDLNTEATTKQETTKAKEVSTTEKEEATKKQSATTAETPSTADETSKINVRFSESYIDGKNLKIKVFTKNNSNKSFSGNVYVSFFDKDGKKYLGSDTIIIDELLPGRESWAIVTVDAYNETPKMKVSFSDAVFSQVETITSEIDKELTEKIKEDYYWNFGVEPDKVSWYDDIVEIIAYKDGNCLVKIKPNSEKDGQFYAAVIWSCGNDYGAKQVQVTDQNGEILSVFKG